MLKTKKPDVDAFISGAKADAASQAPAAKQTKAPAKAKAAPGAEGKRGRGKKPSIYMATIDDETMSRYQLRIPRRLHSESKAAAALAGIAYCDFILGAMVREMAVIEADSQGLKGEARESYITARIEGLKVNKGA